MGPEPPTDLPAGLPAGLLPAGVRTEQCTSVLQARLWPGEEDHAATMAPGRRAEYVTGRACARVALGRLGAHPGPLPSDERGAPTWPDAVVGSLTHCPGLWVAAVARRTAVAGLGIDAEPHRPLPVEVLDVVASSAEQRHLGTLAGNDPGVAWDRLLFSAKESVYKLWSPATGRWLDFGDVDVEFSRTGSFTARLLVPGLVLAGQAVGEVRGRWVVRSGYVVTAAVAQGPQTPSRVRPPARRSRAASARRTRSRTG